ncbi:ATP-dependent RecD-like DNA helicase [candidate division KSB1 bacterium]
MTETHLQGTVLRITFRNEETGYTVAKIQCDEIADQETAIVGTFPAIDVGEMGVFKGKWVHDKQWGRQFSAESFDFIAPSTEKGIERLLSKGKFKGIGKGYARKIVERFGIQTIETIEKNPHRLKEIPGIGKERVETIKRSWERKKALKNISIFLAEKEIPLHYAEKIFSRYREQSITVLRNNPYQITYDIHGIGFKTADKIAMDIGLQKDSNERIQAAILYLIAQAAEEGHVYLPLEEIITQGAQFLQLPEDLLEENLKFLNASNRIVSDQERVYLRYLYTFEQQIVKRIVDIQKHEFDKNADGIDDQIHAIEHRSDIQYTETQKRALRESVLQKILLITGGPGTGKTTIIKAIIALFKARDLKVRLTAPTGRAAKRMEETCDHPAETIHRLLEYTPRHNRFARVVTNPVHADVIIIDETSMIDTLLMSSLLCGTDLRTRVIFVGDADQLPSVGPGNVFKDIIDSDRIPVIRLDTIFRQAETSDIVVCAHAVNHGEKPLIKNGENDNVFFIKEYEQEAIPGKLVDLVTRRLPAKYNLDPAKDIQVITPMYKGNTGAHNLNASLQTALNSSKEQLNKRERTFRAGDKVMQIKNNYDKEVFNGDIGFIRTIDHENETVTVQFEGRRISYDFSHLDQLVLAYAITVHKSQGSEYRAVVMPLTTQHYIMLQKNLLYTALTRAKELMVFIGTYKALNIAVKNDKTAKRYTFLTERLKNPEKYSTQLDFLELAEGSSKDY